MEIYRNETATVSLTGGTQGAVDNLVLTGTDGLEYTVARQATIVTPAGASTYDGVIRIAYTLNTAPRTQFVHVVTPYMIQTDFTDTDFLEPNMTAESFRQLERMVRNVINAYTGQSFGLRKGTINAIWTGKEWKIDQPVVSIESFGASSSPVVTYPTLGGDVLNQYYDPKTDTYLVRNIYNPWAKKTGTKTAPVVGVFGYEYVPFDVHDAAMHLAEMFGCDESLWRDRYLRSMSAADVRVTYVDSAFAGTGSVYADQLLAKYRSAGMVVL